MFTERTTMGLDVHARSVRAAALDTVTGELREAKLGGGTGEAVEWVLAAQRDLGIAAVAYEAGPTGFGLARALEAAGVRCVVAAPSKIRRAAGDKVKTDAKDALLLARMLRMDELTAVRVPTITQESARDLVRAREDARIELVAARHRLSKLLLRHGIVYDAQAWTGRQDAWLRRLRVGGLDGAGVGTLAAFDAAYDTVTMTLARRDRLELVESAWHHKPVYRPGSTMQQRWKLAPAAVVARADAGNRRLNRRWQVMTARKKRHTIATTAIAGELSGWCWSLATMDA